MSEGPTYQWGDMWSQWNQPNSAFIVTTNSSLNRGSVELVMGRGIAKQLRERDYYWAKFFGSYVQWHKVGQPVGQPNVPYGCLVWDDKGLRERLGSYRLPMCWVGIFQVKYHFRDPAVPGIIERSATMLGHLACQHPKRTFNLNYPGIGFGRLTEAVVEPLIRSLPSNVHIWRFKQQQPLGSTQAHVEEDA